MHAVFLASLRKRDGFRDRLRCPPVDLRPKMESRSSRCATSLVTALAALCVLGGCEQGFPTPPLIKGDVTMNGTPLNNAVIIYATSAEGGPEYSANVTAGKYEVRVPADKYKVRFFAFRNVPGKFTEEIPGNPIPVQEQFFPAKYNTATELAADTTSKQKFDFKLELDEATLNPKKK